MDAQHTVLETDEEIDPSGRYRVDVQSRTFENSTCGERPNVV